MKTLPATQGQVILVDDADYEALAGYRWHVRRRFAGYLGIEYRPRRNLSTAEGRGNIFLYNQIMRPATGMVVDHINGNPLDNRRANLRVCTQAQNLRNRRKSVNRKCPFKGVYPDGAKFSAMIRLDGKLRYLGRFSEAEDAAKAYDSAAILHHGEYACTNFAPEAPKMAIAA